MATSAQQEDLPKPNIIVIVHKHVLLQTTIGDYPEYETRRPLKHFDTVDKSKKEDILNSIASKVVHIVVDPLFYDEEFLNLVKASCVNVKRLTIDANLLELSERMYNKKALNESCKSTNTSGEVTCRKLVSFIAEFNGIEELYFGPMLHLIEKIYDVKKWGIESRFSENAKFFLPKFSTDFLNNLNPNLKMIFFGRVSVDSFDLRDVGSRCSVVIKPMKMSLHNQLTELEGGPVHTCLCKVTNLKAVSIKYFENGYHSDTVEELILTTLSGDNKVHEMFPNLKKIRVKMFCPFVMDMIGTGNAGLYDGVVLDELEIEEQIPCFCDGAREIQSSDAVLQAMLHSLFSNISLHQRRPDSRNEGCHCTDVARIGLLKTLKVLKLRCFDAKVTQFISKLHANGSKAHIIVYEKSRFESSADHQSVWNNLASLADAIKIVPHDKIEVVMKKVDESKMMKIKAKLAHYIPDDVQISFTE